MPSCRRIKPHCEVSNALKKWHIAYHGSSVGALRRTLDHSQLLPGRIITASISYTQPMWSHFNRRDGTRREICHLVVVNAHSGYHVCLQGRRPSSRCLRRRQKGQTSSVIRRRTAPPAGRFPECDSRPPCATLAWRSLLQKCSKLAISTVHHMFGIRF